MINKYNLKINRLGNRNACIFNPRIQNNIIIPTYLNFSFTSVLNHEI